MPKVSVLMGVYNGEEHLADAIESILNQTFKDFELIICNDGSSDTSIEIIKHYQSFDPRIKVIENKRNIGLAASLNKCLKLSRGELIARMDGDDIAFPERFAKQVDFLRENPKYDIVGSSVNLFDENGIYGTRKITKEYNYINVFKGSYFIHPTVMMKKESLEKVGGYTESKYTYRTEDYDLWCKLIQKGYQGYSMDEVLLDYREDKNSYKKKKFKYRLDAMRLKKIWFKRLLIPNKYLVYVYMPLVVGAVPSPILRSMKKIL